jgi:redox-sensitive bicupin YhaK (pirin superfamily)
MRRITRIIPAQTTSDGAGVVLKRSIGSAGLRRLDPFLMLDNFGTSNPDDYIAGFPDHPHRGFETVTYMIKGLMRHRDNTGAEGLLKPGGVQWMTAGRGLVHSEMPEQSEGEMSGFQLWVNLPASSKMCDPRYQDIDPDDIPEVDTPDGLHVRVIAGQYADAVGPISGISVDPTFLDVTVPAGGRFTYSLPADHTCFIYPFEGAVKVGERRASAGALAILEDGEEIAVEGADGGRFILVAGKPIGEPVVQHGPFVMNTQAEIEQAVQDFQAGRF